MLTLLFILSVLALVVSFKKIKTVDYLDEDPWFCAIIFSVVSTVITFICMIIVIGCVVGGQVIDDEIAILEQRNESINTSLAEMVQSYTKYETETYEKLKLTDVTVVLQAYPELKTQPLVEQQIQTYVDNQNEITKKQQEKARLKVKRWWLTFNIGE